MSRRERIEQMLAREPNDVFLNFGLAMEFIKEGRIDQAIARFDIVLEHDPDYTAAHYHKGRVLIEAGRASEARSVLTSGIAAARRVGNGHAEGEMVGLLESIGA